MRAIPHLAVAGADPGDERGQLRVDLQLLFSVVQSAQFFVRDELVDGQVAIAADVDARRHVRALVILLEPLVGVQSPGNQVMKRQGPNAPAQLAMLS
jgi:hypothetical protein